MKIDVQELEKLLICNWTAFLNPREILNQLPDKSGPIDKLTVSRFEIKSTGFLVWLDIISKGVSYTHEVMFDFKGDKISERIEN